MIQNMGFWLMKHAAWVAAKDEVFDSDAKECLQCLKRAAGMFAFVSERAGRFILFVTTISLFQDNYLEPLNLKDLILTPML